MDHPKPRREPTAKELAACPSGARLIALANGMFTIVDAEMFDELNRFNWSADKLGYVSQSGSSDSRRTISMARLVFQPKKGYEVDHRNCNKLDNRKCNLRQATRSENCCNCGRRKDNKTGFKGVTFWKPGNCWRAQIQKNRKRFYLGPFSTKKKAAAAYREAALKLHGEFARF